MGHRSVHLKFDGKVFAHNIIDPVGSVRIHPFNGARNVVEIFPLVVACKMTGGLEVLLMVGVKT